MHNDCANSVSADGDDVNRCPSCKQLKRIVVQAFNLCAPISAGLSRVLKQTMHLRCSCLRNIRLAKTLRRFVTTINLTTLIMSMALNQHVWNAFCSKSEQRSILTLCCPEKFLT